MVAEIIEIILYILMIMFWIVLISASAYNIRSTKKWDKKMQEKFKKEIQCRTELFEYQKKVFKLQEAISEANLSVYETPTGKYILVPKEDK